MGHDLNASEHAQGSDSDEDNPRPDGLEPSKTGVNSPNL